MGKFIDMTGWKMWEHGVAKSKITVLYFKEMLNKKSIWHCRCEVCGKEFDAAGHHLRNGETCSCGCQRKGSRKPYKNIIGERFGSLIIEERLGYNIQGHTAIVKCKCDCGNTRIINYNSLLRGANSCGCQKQSFGERKIYNILKENNINFIYNSTYFKDLWGTNNTLLRYDFIILDNNNLPIRIIEFDGIQHYKSIEYFGGEEHYNRLKQNDEIKNNYAKLHQIPLIRIPYNQVNKINLSILLFENLFLIT